MKSIYPMLVLALYVVFFDPIAGAEASQMWKGYQYTVVNSKYVQFSPTKILFQPNPSKTPSTVTRAIDLPTDRPWKVTFDVKLTPGTGAGMSVSLLRGTKTLVWMGAGDYYKHISCFLSADTSNMTYDQTWDNDWHRCEYVYDGETLSFWHNGVKCGQAPLAATPNHIQITSTNMNLSVRNVHAYPLSTPKPLNATKASLMEFKSTQRKSTLFADNFSNFSQSRLNWEQIAHGGIIKLNDDGLALQGVGGGFPSLKTITNPFPPVGDFTASVGYRYTSIGTYGTSISLGDPAGAFFARIHQDSGGQLIQASGLASFSAPANTDWHVISFVKKDKTLSAFLDGEQIWTVPAGSIPKYIEIDGGYLPVSASWDNLKVQFIKVSSGVAVLDKSSLKNEFQPLKITTAVRSSTHKVTRPKAIDDKRVRQDFAYKDATIASLRKELAKNRALRSRLANANLDLTERLSQTPPPGVQVNIDTNINITPLPAQEGNVKISKANLLFSNDGFGDEFCAGQVIIYNDVGLSHFRYG